MNHLTAAGNAARRAVLHEVLVHVGWNIQHAADVLELQDTGAAIRDIRRLGLGAEYEAAKSRGDIRPGGHRKRVEGTHAEILYRITSKVTARLRTEMFT